MYITRLKRLRILINAIRMRVDILFETFCFLQSLMIPEERFLCVTEIKRSLLPSCGHG